MTNDLKQAKDKAESAMGVSKAALDEAQGKYDASVEVFNKANAKVILREAAEKSAQQRKELAGG